jgi:hypothetical protein
MSDSQAKTTKVPAFPFKATVYKAEAGPGVDILVVNMNRHGILCRFEDPVFFTTGHSHRVFFQLPVLNMKVDNLAKVVKTYDTLDVGKSTPGKRLFMVEFHFSSLSLLEQKSIYEYLKLAGLEPR